MPGGMWTEVNGDVSVSTPAMMPHNLPSLDFTTSLNINPTGIRTIDVFICYRRSSGSQLARSVVGNFFDS